VEDQDLSILGEHQINANALPLRHQNNAQISHPYLILSDLQVI